MHCHAIQLIWTLGVSELTGFVYLINSLTRLAEKKNEKRTMSVAKKSKADDLIDPHAFESIEVVCFFENTISGKQYSEGVFILEIDLPRMTLSMPDKSVILHNTGMLEVFTAQDLEEQRAPILRVTGKAEKVEPQEDGSLRVVFFVYQSDERSWKAFLSLFEKRQNEILKLFESQKE